MHPSIKQVSESADQNPSKNSAERENMNRFNKFLEEKLLPFSNKFANIPGMIVMRNAMMALVSVLVVGSMCAMFANFPVPAIKTALTPLNPLFVAMNKATTGSMGLIAAITIGYYAAKQWDVDIVPGMVVSVSGFLASQMTKDGLSTGGFDSNGLLTALLIGYWSVRFMHFLNEKNIGIKMPAGVPEAVAQSLNSLLPITVVVLVFGLISTVFGFEINAFLIAVMQPFANIFNTLPGYVIYHIACGFCFFCGLNSWVIMAPIYPILVSNSAANEAAALAGTELPYIITNATDILIWIGGTGATFGLVLLMIFRAKSETYKAVGKASLLPGIFEINEPVIFGTPICMNFLYFFPFVIFPGIMAGFTYWFMDIGLIAKASVANMTWRMPPVIAGFFMSNGDIRNTLWALILVVVSTLVYYPFFKIGDAQEYKKEQELAKEEEAR